jgi:CBS domain-containing protein
MKKVKDFMRCDVFFVKPNHSVFDVAKVFSQNNISGAPVVENCKVVGVISVSDIIKFMNVKLGNSEIFTEDPNSLMVLFFNLVKLGKDYIDFRKQLEKISKTEIKHMMSKKVVHISSEASLFEAAEMMEKNDVNRLPVVENGRLIGIIARTDLIKALIG